MELSDKPEATFDSVVISGDIDASWKSFGDTTYSIAFDFFWLSIKNPHNWFDDNRKEDQSPSDETHDLHKLWIYD